MYTPTSIVLCILCLLPFHLIGAGHILLTPHSPAVIAKDPTSFERLSPIQQKTWAAIAQRVKQKTGRSILLSALPQEQLAHASHIICWNIPRRTPHWQEKLRAARKKGCHTILLLSEPPSVIPEQYENNVLQLFDAVLTWNDALVDNKKFFKCNLFFASPPPENTLPFAKRKLLTMVIANKRSSHPYELYSKRRAVISFFERKYTEDFDLYGFRWDPFLYKTYKGTIHNKVETLKNYRFCFAYENVAKIPGYITEKIFDCFAAGCVPIYLGAPNIKRYIPQSCYILREDFASTEELYHFVKNMPEEKYNEYLQSIKKFTTSKGAEIFQPPQFIQAVVTQLTACSPDRKGAI